MEKLAIEGGKPVNTEPFPPWPSFSEKTFKMIIEPLKTSKLNYWTGEYGKKFEKELAKWHKAKYCVSTVNEYGAFHLALVSLGIGAGDEVICPSYTYFPPIFAILNTEHCLSLLTLITPIHLTRKILKTKLLKGLKQL